MKFIVAICLCIAYVYAQNQVITPPPVTRDLPANTNPAAPTLCIASTQNKTYEAGQSWSLKPFCGKATCGKGDKAMIERVEDCGQRPKESPGCRYINEADLQKEFPDCCPKFECQPGAKLLYPTEAELKAALEAAQKASQAAPRPGPQGR